MPGLHGFSFPKSRWVTWCSSLDHPKQRLSDIVLGHSFQCQLEVYIPSSSKKEDDDDNASSSSSLALQSIQLKAKQDVYFYYEVFTSLHSLLTGAFYERYFQQSSPQQIHLLSRNSPLDQTNAIAIGPQGILVMQVNLKTYEQLGVYGRNKEKHWKKSDRCQSERGIRNYSIEIDLKSPKFKAGEHVYDALMAYLIELSPMEYCVVCTSGKECDVVEFPLEAQVTRKEVNVQMETFRDIWTPDVVAYNELFQENARQHKHKHGIPQVMGEVQEWLGAVACRLHSFLASQESKEAYVSEHVCVSELEKKIQSSGTAMRWRGLLSAASVQTQIDRLSDYLSKGTIPWGVISVWGIQDCPTSWTQQSTSRAHSFVVEGSNSYTIFLFPKKRYWVTQFLNPYDETS